jgi:outer membrane protein assembly factor BamB
VFGAGGVIDAGIPSDAGVADMSIDFDMEVPRDLMRHRRDLALRLDLATPADLSTAADLAMARDFALRPATDAPSFLVDVAHSGSQPTDDVRPPLTVLWSRDLGATVSYPLIARGKVYVEAGSLGDATTGPTATFYALDETTGATVWGPIDLGAPFDGLAFAAYDDGRVFVVDYSNRLSAYDADSGAQLWTITLPRGGSGGGIDSPPTAANGVVYVGGVFVLSAVDELSGTIKWTANTEGDQSAPTLGDDGVSLSYSCWTTKYALNDGHVLWQYATCGGGGGGNTAVLGAGGLYVRDQIHGNVILDPATGKSIGTFVANAPPAIANGRRFFLNQGTLRRDDTGTVLWTFVGDGGLVTPPLVVGDVVYVGSTSGNLYALDASSGQQQGVATLGGAFAPTEPYLSPVGPVPALAEADGVLVAPTAHLVTAFRGAP